MGKKSTPPAPDYAALATQQGQENRDTAQFNTELNRVNQVTPYGSSTWSSTPGADGKPAWTQTVALSPGQQALENQQNALSQKYLHTADSAVDRVSSVLGQGLDVSGMPATQYTGAGPQFQQMSGGPQFQQMSGGPQLQNMSNGPQFQQFQNPGFDSSLLKGPEFATVSGGGGIARDFDTSKVRDLQGNVDDASRNRVEEAIMSRINPQYQRDEQALRTRLLNSGIEVGTDAYNREMGNFSQRLNDARMQAVLAGGQEESRQVGLNMGLQGQEFNQAYQKGKFGQDADIAMAANAMQAAGINSQNTIAAYNARLNAQGQQFQQGLAGANFNNTWGQQGYDNSFKAANFNNSNAQQGYDNDYRAANFNNSNAQQGYDNYYRATAFNNASGQQAYQNATNSAAFNNSAKQSDVQLQAYLRQLPLNEANALRTGGQVQGPQFGSYYTGGNAQGAPIFDAGVAQGNYNAQVGAQNQSGYNALLGGMANMGAAYISKSDPRLKSNVTRVGTHKLGIGLYEYDIEGRRERGVMSTEVRSVMPQAVFIGDDGFDRVNYGLIGGA